MTKKFASGAVIILLSFLAVHCGSSWDSFTVNKTYSVYYNANACTAGSVPSDLSYAKGDIVTVHGNDGNLSKTGCTFVGWSTDPAGIGCNYVAGDQFVMGESDVVLYARWSVNPTFSVQYFGNGNTSGTVPSDLSRYEAGALFVILGNPGSLAKTGYSFAGWSTALDGGTSYIEGDHVAIASVDVSLYARWVENPTYSVSYDLNGAEIGTVPVDTTRYETGLQVSVKGNSGNLAKAGYTFAGWCVSADGIGTTYQGGDSFLMGSVDIVLYAAWTENPVYSVVYSGNENTDGVAPVDSAHYEEGAMVTVLGNTGNLTRAGYAFAGWCVSSNGIGSTYQAGETFVSGDEDITLYAVWTLLPTYSVTYYGNGNDGGHAPVDYSTYLQGSSIIVLGNSGNLVRDGYTFAGWSLSANGSSPVYTEGDTLSVAASDISLYAVWTLIPTYSVIYDGNENTGGSVPLDSSNYRQGASVTVAANSGNLARSGYHFTGWICSADGAVYLPGATVTMGVEDITLSAQWTPNPTFKISYDGNGNTSGNVPVDSLNYEEGWSVTVLGNSGALLCCGYHFAGWNTEADGSGTAYAPGSTLVMEDENVTLYAQWLAGSPVSGNAAAASGLSQFNAVALDSAGNRYAAGIINKNSSFNFGNNVTISAPFAGGDNCVLVKYNAEGVAQWARTVSGAPAKSAFNAVAVSADGSIYAAGLAGAGEFSFSDSVSVSTTASENILLVKYLSDGTAAWARSVSSSETSSFRAVCVNSAGTVFAAGSVSGTGSYSFGSGVSLAGATSGSRAVVLCYGADGTPQWAVCDQSTAASCAYGVAAASSDGVYVAGAVSGSAVHSFGSAVSLSGSSSAAHAFVVKFTTVGSGEWGMLDTGASSASTFYSVCSGTDGSVYCGGSFASGSALFGGVSVDAAYAAGENALLVSFTADGAAAWSRSVGAAANISKINSVCTDPFGNIFVGGYITGTGAFSFLNDISLTGITASKGSLLASYTSAGICQWAKTMSSGASAEFLAIAAALDGSLAAVGTIYNTSTYTFGSVSVTAHYAGLNAVLVNCR